MLRLDRILANLGYGGRAEARGMVISGRVAVDGQVVRNIGAKARPENVTVDGQPLEHPGGICVALHKPVGYACSHDVREAPLVYDLLPERWMRRNPRPEAVGRLDRDTSGIVIVTDDHDLVHRLASPSRRVEKSYLATLDRVLDDDAIGALTSGELLLQGESSPCRPAVVAPLKATAVVVTISEGRYHQVRRMFAAVGYHVTALHRFRVGPLALDDLAEGTWRAVDPASLAG